MRAVLLDQVHLQDQGFELRTDSDPFDVDDLAYQLARFLAVLGAGMEI